MGTRFAPGRAAIWVPHALLPGRASAWMDAAMLAADRMARTEGKAGKCRMLRGPCLLPRDPLHIGRDVLGVLALEEARGHPALARPAVFDGVENPLAVEPAELVEVGSGDPGGLDRIEGVAALASGDEELLAVLELLARLLGA